jgi:DNA-directed RNA polymerase alpha subunit
VARHRKRDRRKLGDLRTVIDKAAPTQKEVLKRMARIVDPDTLHEMNSDLRRGDKQEDNAKKTKSQKPLIERTTELDPELLCLHIEKLDLSELTEKSLLNVGIKTISELLDAKEKVCHLIGVGGLSEVNEALEDINPNLRIEAKQEFDDIPVDHLELSARAIRGLWRENIKTIGALASRTEEELLQIKGWGQGTVDKAKKLLNGIGITLKT